jgi:FkbM family methyltransferase
VLRAARAVHSRLAGAILAAVPALEAPFIRVGRGVLSRSTIGRGLYWFAEEDLVRRLRRSGERFRPLAIAGHDLYVDVTDGTARLHYFHGEPYEPGLVEAFAATLRPGDVCIDVGANIGFFTVLAARLVAPSGRVVAFEPHPDAIAVLRAALERNGVSGSVDVIAAAAGERDSATTLFVTSDSVLSTTDPERSPLAADFTFGRAIAVTRMALDTWAAAHPDLLARLRAIKIDVEGTEAEVLAGMRQTLATRPSATIFCETSPGSAADGWLTAHGYTGTCLELRQGSFGNFRYDRAS